MITRADPGSWLTATGSARATACPASMIDSGPPRQFLAPSRATAGSVVHGALQIWLEQESWTASDPLDAVRSALREVETFLGTRLMALPSGGRALRSLRSIAAQLSRILLAEGARSEQLSIEVPLLSRADRLWGVPDLVVEGARTLIVDFKTGLESIEAADAAHRQLMFYAYLLRSERDRVADELVVLSPTSAERIICDEEQIERYVAQLRSLREQRCRVAAPEWSLCTYCPLRLQCEPHWEAVDGWKPSDAVRGRLLGVLPREVVNAWGR